MAVIFGCSGLLSVLLWPFFTCHRQVVRIQILGALSFALYFGLEGAFLASASCLVSSGQLAARRLCSNGASLAPAFAISLIALIGLATISRGGSIGFLAVAGSIFGTFARLQNSTVRMKAIFLVGSPLWLIHNLLVGAYFAIAVDFVSIMTNGITLAKTLETLGLAELPGCSPLSTQRVPGLLGV